MKRTTLALLLALTFMVSLVGCGRRNPADNSGMTGNNNPNNGSAYNGGAYDGNTNNGTMNGGTNSDTNNGTMNGNTNNGEGMLQGRSFQEMLEDGRITDDDGDLRNDRDSANR